jgi:hypothetical protein
MHFSAESTRMPHGSPPSSGALIPKLRKIARTPADRCRRTDNGNADTHPSVVAMEGRARTETLIGHNRVLLRRAEATCVYSELVFDEAAESVLMAYAAQLRSQRLLLLATARRARTTMKPPRPLSEQPVGYLRARAAELRSMAMTAHSITAAAALARLAERFEDMAARRLDLPENDGSV